MFTNEFGLRTPHRMLIAINLCVFALIDTAQFAIVSQVNVVETIDQITVKHALQPLFVRASE